MPQVKIKKLSPDAVLPFRGSEGAAAWDITALDVQFKAVQTQGAVRQPKAWWVSTGLAMEIPAGYCLKIYPRSGLGTENFLRLTNVVGIIDSDYRGEIKVRLIADEGGLLVEPKPGMVVAQAMLEKVEDTEWVETDELSDTTRGAAGFGSTTPVTAVAVEDSPAPAEDVTQADTAALNTVSTTTASDSKVDSATAETNSEAVTVEATSTSTTSTKKTTK